MIGKLVMLGGGLWLLSRMGMLQATAPLPGAPGEPSLYVVQLGESLSSIARDELGDLNRWQELAALNQLTPPYVIQPGRELLMPSDYK